MTVRREILQNKTQTTLNGALTAVATTLTAADGAVFPSTGDFRIRINDEIILCTARTGNTLTIVRGQDGTTAAAHVDTDNIRMVLTEGAMQRYGRDNDPYFDSTRPPFRLVDANGDTLTKGDFTTVNLDGSTVTDGAGGAVTVRKPNHAGESITALVRSAPTTPYKIRAAINVCSVETEPATGLVFRESGTGKLYFFANTSDAHGDRKIVCWRYTDPNTFNGNVLTRRGFMAPYPFWMEIEDDGTTLYWRVSHDGVHFIELVTELRTSFMATAPNQVGFGIMSYITGHENLGSLVAWDEGL